MELVLVVVPGPIHNKAAIVVKTEFEPNVMQT